MKILFIIDPLSSLKPGKEASIALMHQSQKQGHQILTCEMHDLTWQAGLGVLATVQYLQIQTGNAPWYRVTASGKEALNTFDAVLMRKDPPVDSEYVYCTHLLEVAQREGAKVFNDPASLRNHQEKLAITEFPEFVAPTLVSASLQEIRHFHARYQDIIIKPLDGMGGKGIFRVKVDGLNLVGIVETLGQNGRATLMVQQFLPAITKGDKRIFVIDGQVVPYCLARVPQEGEVRGNIVAGGTGYAQPISADDLKMAQTIGAALAPRGLFFIGLDVIGDKLTEINVTSPSCMVEITEQTDYNVLEAFITALEKRVRMVGASA